MRIAVCVSDVSRVGGIQSYNRMLLRVLSELGHTVRLVESNGVSCGAKAAFVFRASLAYIVFKPDIVVCGHVNFSPLCRILKILFGCDYIVETYGIDVWDLRNHSQINALRSAAAITSVARYTKEKLADKFPELEEKIIVIPNVVDGEKYRPGAKSDALKRRHRIDASAKVILTVGRLSRAEGYKGYDMILRALPRIVKEVPGSRYLIVGDGDDVPRIKEIIKEKKLEPYVILAGRVPDDELVDYYHLADVFAMPSKGEGFATVFLEALACGIPVIGGNKDGSRDPLRDGELGLLVDPDSEDDIARAIVSVLKREAPERMLRKEALRGKTLEYFGVDKFKERIRMLLQSVKTLHR